MSIKKINSQQEVPSEKEVPIQEQPIIEVNEAGNKLLSDMCDMLMKSSGLSAFGIVQAMSNFTKLKK